MSDNPEQTLKTGDRDYRAYVGGAGRYDTKAATQFSLLCGLGLRADHTLLDIGCGSLRAGRLFIPYLNEGRYFGIEPNKWLVDDGIEQNIGQDLIALRHPTFSYNDDFSADDFGVRFDYVIAQSIFTHAGEDLVRKALDSVARVLKPDGVMAANFSWCRWPATTSAPPGWHYPGNVSYRSETMRRFAQKAGLVSVPITWGHHSAVWWLFALDEARLPSFIERRRLREAKLGFPPKSYRERLRTRTAIQIKRRLVPPTGGSPPPSPLVRKVGERVAKMVQPPRR
jgi:SAM-dependent methyltransferase